MVVPSVVSLFLLIILSSAGSQEVEVYISIFSAVGRKTLSGHQSVPGSMTSPLISILNVFKINQGIKITLINPVTIYKSVSYVYLLPALFHLHYTEVIPHYFCNVVGKL